MTATLNPTVAEKGKLLRILGVSFGIAVTLGGTIGIGILRTPGTVAAQLGSVILIAAAWTLGGIYALFATISVAELATALPQAGGWYVYARRAFGDYAAFSIGWINWFSYCTATAAISIAMAEYAAALASPFFHHIRLIAVALVVLFTLLHARGLRLGSRSQELVSFAVALGLALLIAAAFAFEGRNVPQQVAGSAVQSPSTIAEILVAFALSFQSVIFTYDGWYGAIYFSEEDKDPSRNLPRAMISAVILIIVIYLLLNLLLVRVLPMSQLAASTLPVSDAAQSIFGVNGGKVITALAFVSLVSVTNAGFMMTPRILYGMSRDGFFLRRATTVNRRGTPINALLICTVVEILLIMSGTFEKLLAVTAFFWVVMYSSGFASLIALRRREPELPRPFRAWGYPWTTIVVLFLSFVFLVGVLISDTANSIYALVVLALSYPAYRFMRLMSASPGI